MTTNKDFTVSFTVGQTPAEVLAAIQNVRGWWSQKLKGDSAHVGDRFTYQYEELHTSTQRLTEVSPQKVVWLVEEAQLKFPTADEWKATQVVFDIAPKAGKTELRFTHVGLSPALQCFAACSKGWTFYVGESLRALITTGKGQPD